MRKERLHLGICQVCKAEKVYVKSRDQDRLLACSMCVWGDDATFPKGTVPYGPKMERTPIVPPPKPKPKPVWVTPLPLGDCGVRACGKTNVYLWDGKCAQCSCELPTRPRNPAARHFITPPDPPPPPKAQRPPPPPLPKHPPVRPNAKCLNWTDEEWAWIAYAIDFMPHKTRTKKLYRDVMPWRNDQGIRNAMNIMRRNRLGICPCGNPVDKPGQRCKPCTDKTRQDRRNRLKQGCCAVCGNTLGKGSSGTLCADCRERRKKYKPASAKRFRARRDAQGLKQDPRDASQRILPWPACGHVKWAAKLAAGTQRPVVDLFGGSGEPLRLLHAHGGLPHHYNDLHQGLVELVQAAKDGRIQPVVDAIKAQDHTNLAANTFINARKPGAAFPRAFPQRMKTLGNVLRTHDTTITNQDAIELLDQPDQFPDNSIFLIDPPWPGSCGTRLFDHQPNFPKLLTLLLDLPYEQDYILMLGSEREALVLAAKFMRHAPIYWRTFGSTFAKSLVSLSPRLAKATPDLGIPVRFTELGL